MPARTEKKRNSGVRKLETAGLTPMATPSGMLIRIASSGADGDAAEAGADVAEEGAVLDGFEACAGD